MNARTLLFLFFGFLLSASLYAQTAKPARTARVPKGVPFFEETVYDFGLIEENQGRVRARFILKNLGRAPITIKSVESGCGCTVPDWSKEPIAPEQTGFVDAEYDPLNRVGVFSKTLNVHTDGDPETVYLIIKGEVFTEKMEIRTAYPLKQGNMRFTRYDLNLQSISEYKLDSVVYTVYNSSKREMLITNIVTPPHITYKVNQKILMPGNTTDIVYYYDASKANDLGPRTDQTFIYTTDDTLPKKMVTVRAYIQQDFSKMSDEVKKSPPVANWKSKVHEFGEVYLGEVVTYEFEVVNKGKTPLVIREAEPSCGCTVTSYTQLPVKKGKSGKVRVTLNAKGLRGQQEKSVNVYTNDPANPITTLKIKAKVVIPGVDPLSGK